MNLPVVISIPESKIDKGLVQAMSFFILWGMRNYDSSSRLELKKLIREYKKNVPQKK
jgi:hypothetical protein